MTTLAGQLICLSSSSSTSTQQFSVARRLARPPAARRISKLPQPISLATAQTASSSPISPSSSSVTQMVSMPSDSNTRLSSSLMTWPLAKSFFPPGRNTVQQRIRPVEDFTSTVCALMFASQLPESDSNLGVKYPKFDSMLKSLRIRGLFQRFYGGVGSPYFGGYRLHLARCRGLKQFGGGRVQKRPRGLRPPLRQRGGQKYAKSGVFIAGLELRAAYAVLPCLEG